jgi:hypothetical protein
MAKDDKTVLEQHVETLMEGMLELKRQNAALKAHLDDQTSRVERLSAEVSMLQQDTLLPPEVRDGLTPATLYTSAVQAFIIGYIGSNPSVLLKSGESSIHGQQAINKAIEFGDNVVKAFQSRWGEPREKPKK